MRNGSTNRRAYLTPYTYNQRYLILVRPKETQASERIQLMVEHALRHLHTIIAALYLPILRRENGV